MLRRFDDLDYGRAKGRLEVVRQNGDLNQMIWKVPEQIAYLSRFYDIAAGDLIMSGTPAGVGSIHKGEIMECRVDDIDPFIVKVV